MIRSRSCTVKDSRITFLLDSGGQGASGNKGPTSPDQS